MLRSHLMQSRLTSVLLLVAVLTLSTMLIGRQTPYGTVAGLVLAEDNGAPLAGARVCLTPRGGAESPRPLRTDARGAFRGRVPAGAYTLQVTTRAHRLRPRTVRVAEGGNTALRLLLEPLSPFLEMVVHQQIHPPSKPAEVGLRGFVRQPALQVTIYRTDQQALVFRHHGRLGSLLGSEGDVSRADLAHNPALTLVRSQVVPLTTRDAEGLFYERVQLPLPQAGVYVVAAEGDGVRRVDWVMQTDLALVVKSDSRELLAAVTDLSGGTPVAGAAVTAYRADSAVADGTTGADGTCRLALPPSPEQGGEDDGEVVVLTRHAGSEAFVSPYLYPSESKPSRVYFQTDRPLYRPGHTVCFREVVRRLEGDRYVLPASGEPVVIEARDPRNTLVYRARLALGDQGSLHDHFTLNPEAATGEYRVVTRLADREYEDYFTVAAYRKPEYEVKIATDQPRYARGDKVRATLSAVYYFGSPVPGAEIDYRVYRSPYWYEPPEESEEAEQAELYEEDGGYGVEFVSEGKARTDAQGNARLSFPTGLTREGEETDYRYTISATVTDASDREVDEDHDVLVTRGAFRLLLAPERDITPPRQPLAVQVRAVTYEGQPVSGLALEAGLARQEWDEETSEPRTVDHRLSRITTDAEGKASFTVTPPQSGDFCTLARAVDSRGNHIEETAFLWVTSEQEPMAPLSESLSLKLDRKSYRVGDTATVLVTGSARSAAVLVTVEGERLYEHRVLRMRGGSAQFALPVREEFAPNVYLSAAQVHKGELDVGQAELRVTSARHTLQVQVAADKPQYRPGETVTLQVRTRTTAGAPVPAEVAVGVVDEALYALAPEGTVDIGRFFYPTRENSVNTDYSFPQVYLSADKASVPGVIRRHFPDTAYWNPAVHTDAAGQARLTFAMPDTLTTWRTTATAATVDTAVGQAAAKTLCRLPFSVRLEAPRFFTQSDRVLLAAIVHNETGAAVQAQVRLQGPGLTLEGEAAQTVPAGTEPVRVQWWATATQPGQVPLTVSAQAGQYTDAVSQTVPCLPRGYLKRQHPAGVLRAASATIPVQVRSDAIAGASALRLHLSPSLIATAYGALDYLAHYPYGCVEQTMSCFLPDIAVYQALRDLRLPTGELGAKLPEMVNEGLSRLYNMQHEDGGWGWWRYDQTDVWMTAYVLAGMAEARRAGFTVNQQLYNRGLEALEQALYDEPGTEPESLALAALAFAEAGRAERARALSRRFRYGAVGSLALANLVRARWALGDRAEAAAALDQLLTRGTDTQAACYWATPAEDRWVYGDTDVTATALLALLQVRPEDERVDRVVRWLVSARQGDGWLSTRDTAMSLLAICAYLRTHPLPRGAFAVTVLLDGTVVKRVPFPAEALYQPEVTVTVPPGSLTAGNHQLVLRREGAGELWWTLDFSQMIGAPGRLQREQTGAQIVLSREYHRLVARRDSPREPLALLPEPQARTRFCSGDVIEVRLRVDSRAVYQRMVIEEPIPAGCEVTDRSDLAIEDWDSWWGDQDIRDDRVCFFIPYLTPAATGDPDGARVLTYHLRAQLPGSYSVLPTTAYSMYLPDLRATGEEERIEVTQ